MSLAKVSAFRSKDPSTKVGAVLVNDDNRVVGLGYNGMPEGNDVDYPWKREGQSAESKYSYVVHAEMNAILNTTATTKGSTLFVTLFPCSACAKFLVQAGIKEVIYEDDKYNQTEDAKIAKYIFDKSGIKYHKMDSFDLKIS